jgi:hypothetical protein
VVGEERGDGEAAEGAVGGHFGGFEHAGVLGLDGVSGLWDGMGGGECTAMVLSRPRKRDAARLSNAG